jgi:homoserine kinase
MQQVTVRVPASTSNLGPGFDCLGVALRLYNYVTIARDRRPSLDPMVRDAAKLFFDHTDRRPFRFSCSVTGEIPRSRGLGSSVTVRLGVLHGLNALTKKPLNRQEIFQLAAQLEGHPDNAAPAEFGGFNVARGSQHQQFKVSPRLHFVLMIPNFEIATSDARRLLSPRIARLDAVESCGNACAITAAFASRDYQKLRGAFVDHLHQPFRKKLIPFFDDVIAAGEGAGALGGFLSGSGSTIVCVTLRSPQKIAAAMLAAARTRGVRTLITAADNQGARLF